MEGDNRKNQAVNRDRFTTWVGVFAATLGSAVGLGNIWKFPSMAGTNGGASFIFVYLILTVLVGIPVMIAEHTLGRTARADSIGTFRKLAPKGSFWWVAGALGVLAAFLILAFYTVVSGWVFAYIGKTIAGGLLSTDPEVTTAAFASLAGSPWQSLIWQWIVLIWIGAIIMLGVSRGIEMMTKRLVPILFLILVALCIRGLTLPGVGEGLSFLFKPDFSKITFPIILAALGLSFFKLSVGMGTMITYGSYFREEQNIPKTALQVMLADLTVSILAGIAIFPAVFTFGFEPTAGPNLLFITIPAVFASMPAGGVFMFLFFVLAGIAATGAMLSLLEVPVAYMNEQMRVPRKTATLITVLLLALIGSTAALSGSTMSEFKIAGMTMFDLFDFVTSNILLPVGGLIISLFIGWVWGRKNIQEALTNKGTLKNERIVTLFIGVIKFITPLLILVILLSGLKIIG